MRIAVIIVNHNAGVYLARTLGALSDQRRPPDRVVVVDNASSDGSAAVCSQHIGVELIDSAVNLGFAEANNRAARLVADCDWIAFLNPDAFPEPDWLLELQQATLRHPDVPLFASRQLMAHDPTRLDGAGDGYHVSGLAWRHLHGAPVAESPETDAEVFSACAAAALCRRDVFLDLGGFDSRFFAYMEDVDFGFRLRLAGYRCVYVPSATVLHVGSGTSSERSDFATYHGHRNVVWTFVKNMPGWWIWRYLPQHLLMTAVAAAHVSARGQLLLFMRAKLHAIRGLREMLASRRQVQQLRCTSLTGIRAAMTAGWLRACLAFLARRTTIRTTVPR